ncbi:MAG TPA: membrane protein insertase YidC [bacterium]|nr:membrane protein insertase YidC [bacterium]HEX67900.1 membrane protein insertase YidC [bacterium]
MERRILLIFLLLFLFLMLFHPPPPKKEKITLPEINPPPLPSLSERILWETSWGILQPSTWGGFFSCQLTQYKERDYGLKNLFQEKEKIKSAILRAKKETLKILAYQLLKVEESIKYFTHQKGKNVELISFAEKFHQKFPPYLIYEAPDHKPIFKDGQDASYLLRKEKGKIILESNTRRIRVRKEFSLTPNPYLIKTKITLYSNSPLPPGNLLVMVGPDVGYPEGGRYYGYQGPLGWIDGKLVRISLPRKTGNTSRQVFKYGKVEWVAVQNPYFTQVLITSTPCEIAYFTFNEFKEGTAGLKWEFLTPSKEKERSVEFFLYLGPKKVDDLKLISPTLPLLIDFGKFGNLFRVIYILNFFYHLTHNYGWAIILLTLVINLILFPLSWKSFHSMKIMQKLHPEIEALRKKYHNDPQKLNREIMELYRKHGINPMGGCLPMFFQMPVFIALFTTLRSAIELRGAPFIAWIKDLSLPDNFLQIGGFSLHLLPILMGVTMFFQQRLTSAKEASNPFLSTFMPIFFVFIFYNFPSGLVLYWFTNSILSIIEQVCILRFSPSSSS